MVYKEYSMLGVHEKIRFRSLVKEYSDYFGIDMPTSFKRGVGVLGKIEKQNEKRE